MHEGVVVGMQQKVVDRDTGLCQARVDLSPVPLREHCLGDDERATDVVEDLPGCLHDQGAPWPVVLVRHSQHVPQHLSDLLRVEEPGGRDTRDELSCGGRLASAEPWIAGMRPEGTSRAHEHGKRRRTVRTTERCFRRSADIPSRSPRSTPRRSQSLHEWQDFSHRLHEAGHQPYCLVWP